MTPLYLRPRDAAELTGISEGTLRNWRSAEKGPPFRRAGRAILYPRDELIEWIEGGKQ